MEGQVKICQEGRQALKRTQATCLDVVWLKRDVRLHDHGPLHTASTSGRRFLILFIYEPDQLAHHSVHGSHAQPKMRDLSHSLRGQGRRCITHEASTALDTSVRTKSKLLYRNFYVVSRVLFSCSH